ncbi:hypothetical protein CYQ88_08840 [Hydrogenovibrio sp. SC-1]|uniref:hypothetical protein n=1 Tax=Hydrogenovibrio sp. SC-1 TaxID=2065820 RepID=UPI000C7A9A7F|nr:hypothetical protein [Hydrogenovibrio sp. SC-1]PLA73930.1 hypothetical protein CYQ88_08840 [Hydrogenovibrio sp. SC-1]
MLLKKALLLSVLSSMMWVLTPMTLQAQPPAAQNAMPKLNDEQKAMMMELQRVQQSLQQTQQALQKIQQKVYQDNPKLKSQRDDLQKSIAQAMSDDDYNAESELAALNQLVEKYQNTKEQPTQQQISDFQAKQQAFQQRQRAAFQNPDIQKQAEALQVRLRKAIEQSGESGQSLLVRLEEQMKKLKTLRQKAMQMMQGSSAP